MTKAKGAYHKRDLYSDVTTRILAELQTGAAPWVNPGPQHPDLIILTTQRLAGPYSGCNVILLWMTAQRHGHNQDQDAAMRAMISEICAGVRVMTIS